MTSDSEDTLRKLRALKPSLKEWKIKRLRVFGSVARGTATAQSDIDLIVDFFEKPSYFGFIGMEQELSEKLGKKVELFTEDSIHSFIKEKIINEARDV